MLTRAKYAIITSVVMACAVVSAALAQTEDPAAVVVDVHCIRDECTYVHRKVSAIPKRLTWLYPGDSVVVRGRGVVEIVTSDRETRRLDASHSPYRMLAPRPLSSFFAKLWQQTVALFKLEEELPDTPVGKNITVPSVTLCGLPADKQFLIVAGDRKIAVPIKHGVGPFRLFALGEAGPVGQSEVSNSHWLMTPKTTLRPGKLLLTVKDLGTGISVSIYAEVVAKAPAEPADLVVPGMTELAFAELRSIWLASEADGIWRLEAAAEAADNGNKPDNLPALFARCSAK